MTTFTRERTEDGVTERLFDLTVAGERVPAVLWAPEGAAGSRPLVLMGHGGSQHKKIGSLAARARSYARKLGYAVLAIDAPGHGDRVSREEAAKLAAEVGARVRGEAGSGSFNLMKTMAERTARAVPEWKAALDAVQALPFVGKHERVGYWGVSMGTAIGVPFVSAEPRITCAVFGLAGLRPGMDAFAASASAITIPVEFVSNGKTPSPRATTESPSSTPSPPRKRRCTSTPAPTSRSRHSRATAGRSFLCGIWGWGLSTVPHAATSRSAEFFGGSEHH